jgi:hypothetical protein
MQALLLPLLGLAAALAPPQRPAVPFRGCDAELGARFEVGPHDPGPLRLEEVVCVDVHDGDSSPPLLSPDGNAVARWGEGREHVLEIAPLDGSRGLVLPHRVSAVFRLFVGLETHGGAFAWTGDSRGLWAVRQRSLNPGGFALGPLEPVRVGRDGAVRTLPTLRHPSGPLDAIKWVGGDGLALAQFGTRGAYYRPAHADPAPTLAMVDAARGRVLASLPLLDVPGIGDQMRAWGFMARDAAATVLPDGRMRAVLLFNAWRPQFAAGAPQPPLRSGHWLVWTQGEPARLLPHPHVDFERRRIAFLPGGRRLLVAHAIQAAGTIVEHGPSPPPIPVTDVAAELLDVETGRSLWRIEARAERMWNSPANVSAVSPDGRHALIVLPPGPDDHMTYALVELRTGRIVQRIRPLPGWDYEQSFGFTADGRRAWVATGGMMLFYRFAGRQTIAKARTGKVPMPAIFGGTAVKAKPASGSAASRVICSQIGTPAPSRMVWTGRVRPDVSSIL